MNLNKVFVLGNLAKDPEVRTIPSGQQVATFSVATNRIWYNQAKEKNQEVEFHNIVAWGRLAEIAGQYLTKGKLVLIEGRIKTRSWQAQDGTKKYRTEIIAEAMQMGPKTQGTSFAKPESKEETPVAEQSAAPDNSGEITTEEVPF
ncbi:single-stranded DNA-binding protein [Patescibacteria group bacterium]|nr:single-stranded DNA-binding protein [Patescibacteria group bacterium]MBU4141817.1 single-stranded DNA-binding protein [Patescibacteria group bacterium]MBU4338725.1 single-stranded DNA-binding protein [Patescibacteria group bacterium]MBU4580497.1 single-stranded DNA-binding protein [Patescibacteria group bacterium]